MKLARFLFLAFVAGITGLTAQTHPRLFFDAAELTQIRTKLDREPFKTMLTTLEETKDVGNFYLPIPPNDPSRLLMRASAEAMLYSLTGIEQHAVDCKADVVEALALIDAANDWADPTLKGLTSYWYATRTAMCYDLCYHSPSWDATFKSDISARLLSIATMIINNGGTEQNSQFSSNWQANRAASGGIALLATDETYDVALMDSAMQRLNNFFNANQGSSTRGWNPEGVGYTAYLYGSFVGPFAIALDRLQPARSVSNQPGMKWMPWTAFSGAVPATANNPYNVYGLGGVKTDWSDDNAHIGGEGLYGLAFRFSPPSLLPGLRHSYDRLQGSLAPDGGLWDASRHGIFWSILYYPENSPPQNPLEIWDWQDANGAPVGLGLTTFRDGFRGENDILVHFKARTKVVDSNSHDGPDGLGFRILGPNAPFVVGGGRDNPGRDQNQATVYPNNPNVSPVANKNAGTYHGTPLIKPDGSGHAIASMTANNVGTSAHKRWIVTDFDRATTGADATVIVADTTGNGRFWQLPTYLDNTLTVTGSVFTITGQNGATLQGTIIHPGGTPLVTVGTKARGQGYTLQNGGTLATQSVSNPQVLSNRYLYIENTTDNNFLVVMTIQKNGGRHPVVARNAGTIADAVIQVGGRSYGLQTDNVLYDGVPYVYPDSTVTFTAGPNGSVAGSTVQSIARGAAAAAPTATPDAGFLFAGWNKAFDKVTTPMTVTALFTPTAGPAPTLALAVSSWRIDEAAGTATIGVTRGGDLTGAVGVSYTTANGSATAGDDYTAASGTLSWADGDGATKNITISISQDTILEMDEDFTVSLSNPTGGAILTDPVLATVSIADDESLPVQSTLAFTNQNVPVSENGGSVSISVARLLSTTGAVTVNYSTSPGIAAGGVDFTPVSGTLSWADGEVGTKSFNVAIIDDLLVEPNETFAVTLTAPTGGAVLGSPATATVTIIENEVNVQPAIAMDRPANGVASVSSISQSLQLAATTSDDGEPGPLTFLWEKISGPGSVTFGNAASEDTFASFSVAGVYQLRLTASDGLLSDSKIVLVNVAAAGGITQRFAEYPFTHAANDPTPLTPTVLGSNMTVTPVSLAGVAISDSASNVLRLAESGGTGGLATSFSNSTDHVWFRLNANPGYYFDLTSTSAPRLQFQLGRVSAPTGTNIVGRMQVWAAASGSATTASTLVYTSSEITPTSSTLVTMNDTSGIALANPTNRYTSLLVQVQWKGTASSSYGTLTMDNILVDGAVVAAVDNVGPTANAGPDTVAQINTAFPLSGSATDDGLPASPGSLTCLWQKVSGPGNVVFADAGNPATTATFSSTGIHVLSLSADDGAIATSDTVTLTVTSDVPLPPAPASGLAASAIAYNRIDLTWTDNASDEAGFKILRSLTSGSGFAEIATTAANATSYSDATCAAETLYYYQVVATNVTGDSTPSNEATATTPVAPPPAPGSIRLSSATYQAAENAESVTLTAQRVGGVSGEVSVSYSTANGSATAGADYTAASGTLTWLNGDAVDKTVVVTLLDDTTFEGNETFTLELTNVTGATFGTPVATTVTILDNETAPPPVATSIVVTPANAVISANATQQFSAVLRDQFGQPMASQPAFSWSVTGGGTINTGGFFAAGNATGSFTVSAAAESLTGSTGVTVETASAQTTYILPTTTGAWNWTSSVLGGTSWVDSATGSIADLRGWNGGSAALTITSSQTRSAYQLIMDQADAGGRRVVGGGNATSNLTLGAGGILNAATTGTTVDVRAQITLATSQAWEAGLGGNSTLIMDFRPSSSDSTKLNLEGFNLTAGDRVSVQFDLGNTVTTPFQFIGSSGVITAGGSGNTGTIGVGSQEAHSSETLDLTGATLAVTNANINGITLGRGGNGAALNTIKIDGLSGTSALSTNRGGITFNTSNTVATTTTVQLVGSGSYTIDARIRDSSSSPFSGSALLIQKTGSGSQTFAGAGTAATGGGSWNSSAALQVENGKFVISGDKNGAGAMTVNGGTLIVNGTAAGATTVNPNGTLGGSGTVAAISLGGGGSSGGILNITNDANSNLVDLNATSLTWNGTDSVFSQMKLDLSASGATSDQLLLSGAMTKGTGSLFQFDFGGTGDTGTARAYTLVTATGGFGTFVPGDFSYTGLPVGVTGNFTIVGNDLIFTTVVSGGGNTAPTISAIADQTINAGTSTNALPIIIGDGETAAGGLSLTGSSSNLALVPNANIVFGGSGANRTVTVTPAAGQSGSATITVTVSDGALMTPETFDLTVIPPPASDYATWSDTAFPAEATPEERAPAFDFDNDGLSNLLEYGLGSDPAAASTAPAAQVVEITGQKYLQIQWTRPNDRTDITTLGEISDDLAPLSWTTAPAEVLTTITPAGEGLETVTIRDADPVNGNTKRFLRARIQLTSP